MIKMEIVLDNEKMLADGGHDLFVEVYTHVDNVATGYKLTLQPIENNKLVYCARDRADDCSYIGLTCHKLKNSEEFMKYCKEWRWIEIHRDGEIATSNLIESVARYNQQEALL